MALRALDYSSLQIWVTIFLLEVTVGSCCRISNQASLTTRPQEGWYPPSSSFFLCVSLCSPATEPMLLWQKHWSFSFWLMLDLFPKAGGRKRMKPRGRGRSRASSLRSASSQNCDIIQQIMFILLSCFSAKSRYKLKLSAKTNSEKKHHPLGTEADFSAAGKKSSIQQMGRINNWRKM